MQEIFGQNFRKSGNFKDFFENARVSVKKTGNSECVESPVLKELE